MVEAAICKGSTQALVKEEKQEGHVNALGGEPIGVTTAIALNESVSFKFAQIVAELVEYVLFRGELEGGENRLVNLLCSPAADGTAVMQEEGMANWIDCHVQAFEFFGGTTTLLVPDNPRTGVTRACRYEPDLNRTYHEVAQYYRIAVLPARPYKPRDKAKDENAVGIVERWILAALRHRKF